MFQDVSDMFDISSNKINVGHQTDSQRGLCVLASFLMHFLLFLTRDIW